MFTDRHGNFNGGRFAMTIIGAIVVIVLLIVGFTSFGYLWYEVAPEEIGIQFRSSQITNVVGPGRYSDWPGFFRDIETVSIKGLQWCAEDPEVLTKDQQRIGVKVCGTVHRPDLSQANAYVENWGTYRTLYTDDTAVVGPVPEGSSQTPLMVSLAQQAMKVCVGERTFADAVVGEARDTLGACIDEQISELAANYTLDVRNVVVPNISLHPKVQELMDQITNSKFETDLARQNALKAEADAARALAEQQGQIKVEQGRLQETQRQAAVTAELERKALEAQLQVIAAQKANELKEAQLNKEIEAANLEVAEIVAKQKLADEFAKAGLYADNPEYLRYLVDLAWAEAWKTNSKFVIPAGTDPELIMNPDGITPVVPVNP